MMSTESLQRVFQIAKGWDDVTLKAANGYADSIEASANEHMNSIDDDIADLQASMRNTGKKVSELDGMLRYADGGQLSRGICAVTEQDIEALMSGGVRELEIEIDKDAAEGLSDAIYGSKSGHFEPVVLKITAPESNNSVLVLRAEKMAEGSDGKYLEFSHIQSGTTVYVPRWMRESNIIIFHPVLVVTTDKGYNQLLDSKHVYEDTIYFITD